MRHGNGPDAAAPHRRGPASPRFRRPFQSPGAPARTAAALWPLPASIRRSRAPAAWWSRRQSAPGRGRPRPRGIFPASGRQRRRRVPRAAGRSAGRGGSPARPGQRPPPAVRPAPRPRAGDARRSGAPPPATPGRCPRPSGTGRTTAGTPAGCAAPSSPAPPRPVVAAGSVRARVLGATPPKTQLRTGSGRPASPAPPPDATAGCGRCPGCRRTGGRHRA